MDKNERYYLYRYFEAKRNELGQILLEDVGVNPTQAQINLQRAELKITIKTTKSNYSKVAQKIKELLSKHVKYEVIDVDENDLHYVPCMYDRRFKKNFRKKFEEKYNVVLMKTATDFYNHRDYGNTGGRGGRGSYDTHGGRGGRGGGEQHFRRQQPETFDSIEVPNEIQPLNYSYVVVGNHLDIKIAIQGINKSIAKYIKVEDVFPYVPEDLFKNYLSSRDRIKQETGVYFYSEKGLISYLGKADNIKEA